MRIEAITNSNLYQEELQRMPIFQEFIKNYTDTLPFRGENIGFSHVMASNTLPMIIALLKGGADLALVVTNPKNVPVKLYDLIKQSQIPVYDNIRKFDYVVDCCGSFVANPPRKGVVEVTRSGIHKYKNHFHQSITRQFKLVDVDNSMCKLLETFFGNPQAVIKTLEFFKGDIQSYLTDKQVGIVGFGKIGRGLARLFSKYTDVLVFDISREVIDLAVELGFLSKLLLKDSKKNTKKITTCDIIITATGYEDTMSNYFEKKDLNHILKINVGAVDEWGSDYSESEIFHSKFQPFNFNLDPPTESKYIDPILALQLEGLKSLIERFESFEFGHNPIPLEIDKSIFDQFEKIHGRVLPLLEQYFPDMKNYKNYK